MKTVDPWTDPAVINGNQLLLNSFPALAGA